MSKSASVTGVEFYPTGGGAGAATLSREERLYPPKARAIAEEEERRNDERHDAYESLRKRLDRIRVDMADADIALAAARRARKPDAAVEARYEAQIEAFKAQLRDEQKKYDDRRAKTAGSAASYVREFMSRNGKPTRDCDTTFELAPGKTARETMDILRNAKTAKLAEKKSVVRAPRTADEITAEISIAVDRLAHSASTGIRKLRSVIYHEDIDKLEVVRYEPPQLTLANGVGGLSHVPDAVPLLFALIPEEAKRGLYALALAGHDDATALSMEDRRAAIDAINAEILLIERKSEAIVRHCFENGIEPGPRLTSNPLAILDIEYF